MKVSATRYSGSSRATKELKQGGGGCWFNVSQPDGAVATNYVITDQRVGKQQKIMEVWDADEYCQYLGEDWHLADLFTPEEHRVLDGVYNRRYPLPAASPYYVSFQVCGTRVVLG